jgi:predicted transposase/invertase (TIGR01784 family)
MTKTNEADVQQDNTETPSGDFDKTERFDHDGLWKDLVERFAYSLLKRAIPELYEDADKETKPRLLDKEFRDILNTSDPEIHTSPHFADYVMEVPLKNGDAEWVILHIEAQGHGGGGLPERMNHYRCLIYAHYRREPAALAIVTENRPVNEAAYYSHKAYGTDISYRYNNLVLSELGDGELMSSDNPIDLALYAAKCALRSKEELQKYNYLYTLTDLLGERGWSMNDKRDLLLFLERIMNLKDEQLRTKYEERLEQLDKEEKIMYVSVVEEFYTKKGREEMARELAKNLLANGVSPDVIAKSAGLPLNQIQSMMN